jgi:stress response protein SCP2
MAMGENKTLPATHIRAQLRWSQTSETPDVDLCALVLNSTDKVSADSDFVFYNQPEHPSRAIKLHPKTVSRFPTQTLEMMLTRIPADMSKIVIACSCDDGVLSSVADLHLVVLAGDHDAELARFVLTGRRESALIAGEIYRRRSEWKFRAVGQGYLEGLAGLATDYGILVSDSESDAAADSEASTPYVTPSAVAAGTPHGATPAPIRVDADAVLIEIGGLARPGLQMPDLDLCALAFNAQRKLVDIVWFLHPAEFDDGLVLTNADGAGAALDEPQLTAKLAELPQHVQHIVVTASSLRGHQLSDWHGLTLRISDPDSGRDVVVLEAPAAATASILGSLSRSGDGWIFTPLMQDKRAASGRDLVVAGSDALAAIAVG